MGEELEFFLTQVAQEVMGYEESFSRYLRFLQSMVGWLSWLTLATQERILMVAEMLALTGVLDFPTKICFD